MKIVAISDTHGFHNQLTIPDGDVLVHGGDLSHGTGTPQQVWDFNKWLGTLPHKHKVMIPGNHDFPFENDPEFCRKVMTNCHLLINEEIVIDGVKFWGSPVTPWFHDWAYNVQRGEDIAAVWKKIPDDTDVLITHGPPFDVLDKVERGNFPVGCEELAKRVIQVAPKVHIFGHIHEGYGQLDFGGIKFRNVSICTFRYQPTNPPTVIDI